MKIWMCVTTEPMPICDNREIRLRRGGILAETLQLRGHDVIWWGTDYDHFSKKRVGVKSAILGNGVELKLLHGISYKSNISVKRILNHICVAHHFTHISEALEQPDVIICAMPTIELSLAASRYGLKHGIPVFVDVRDLWPDVFVDPFPQCMHRVIKFFTAHYSRNLREVMENAKGIIAPSDGFLKWGLKHARRETTRFDCVVPFGYQKAALSPSECSVTRKFWDSFGVCQSDDECLVVFAGSMSSQFDFTPIIECARDSRLDKRVKFVMCGNGDLLTSLRRQCRGLTNVVIPGFVNRNNLAYLLSISKIGLAPYRDKPNFRLNVTNKIPEYLAYGIPIMLSLTSGTMYDVCVQNQCGVSYANDSVLLKERIGLLIDNVSYWQVLSTNCTNEYKNNYVSRHVYEKYVKHLVSINKT